MNVIVFGVGVALAILGLTCGLSCRYFPVMDTDTQVPIHGTLSTLGIVVMIIGGLV